MNLAEILKNGEKTTFWRLVKGFRPLFGFAPGLLDRAQLRPRRTSQRLFHSPDLPTGRARPLPTPYEVTLQGAIGGQLFCVVRRVAATQVHRSGGGGRRVQQLRDGVWVGGESEGVQHTAGDSIGERAVSPNSY